MLNLDVTGINLSVYSISRRLKKEGIHARVAAAEDFLTEEQKVCRADFGNIYGDKDNDYWAGVGFCDEKTFGYVIRKKCVFPLINYLF